jgi:nucleoside-diphosphate-sugar epimerase
MENARLSPVDIEDIAKVAFALLRSSGHEGKSYDMTGPEALTMAEIAEQISQATGRTIEYVNITLEEYRRAVLAAGASPERADGFVELWSERRKCSESRVYLGTHEAFGVQPTTFAEFALRNAAVFRGESALS